MQPVDRRDVLMFVRSEDIIRRVLPPDAHDEALRAFHSQAFFCVPLRPHYAGATSDRAGRPVISGTSPCGIRKSPEVEEDAIQLAVRAVHGQGRNLYIVDVGKESALRRVISEHLNHLHRFPVLVRRGRFVVSKALTTSAGRISRSSFRTSPPPDLGPIIFELGRVQAWLHLLSTKSRLEKRTPLRGRGLI